MQTEVEAKFLNIDHESLRARLKQLGAELKQPMRLMRRVNLDYPDERLYKVHGWVRVRDEGDKVTLAYKQLDGRGLHDTKEVQVTVSDFDVTRSFLQSIGLEEKSYQETKRESWRLGEVEIELDIWPWALPYIEIEGPDETAVKDAAVKLGMDWSAAVHGSVEVVYRAEYDVTDEEFDDLTRITFEETVPDWLEARRRTVDTDTKDAGATATGAAV